MSRVSELYQLQETDLEIDAKRAALAETEEQIGETEEMLSAREAVDRLQETVAELRKRLRAAEYQVDDVDGKIQPLNKKLYGGTIRNPKELSSIEDDVKALLSHKRKLEDQVLEVMAELEEAEATLAAARKNAASIQAAWEAEQERLKRQKATLEEEIARLDEQRRAQSERFDAATLAVYDSLRVKHQGRAVAKVERGMCQGCRISLPMTLLQKARSSGDGLVHCSSCERILYVS
ncbi:MAG: hypothetical protein QME71_00245 [Dehalococcoidia bacterium]|nr:hypothetical protein [Dehalococcoidia bacterium]